MKPRERVLRVLGHRETDIIPYNIPISKEARRKLISHSGRDLLENIEDHFAKTAPAIYPCYDEDLVNEYWRDEFGTLWRRGNIFHLEEPPLKVPSLAGYTFPDLAQDRLYEHCGVFCKENQDKYKVFELGLLFFERSWALRGFDKILMDMVRNSEFCDALYDSLMELHLEAIDKAAEFPFDAILFSDDFGQQKGLIMGPPYWRRYLKPRLKVMYEHAHRKGFLVAIHSCGDNSPIMEDLIEIGVDIFHPFQPEAMNTFELKQEYGHIITFHGGISSQKTLPHGKPREVEEEIKRCLRHLGEGGGYVAEPAKPILDDVPPENAATLIKLLTDQPI